MIQIRVKIVDCVNTFLSNLWINGILLIQFDAKHHNGADEFMQESSYLFLNYKKRDPEP